MLDAIKKYYNAIAKGYDELYGEEQIRKYRFAVKNGLRVTKKKVLDVGCGTGLIIYEMLKDGAADITGVDISESMINLAKIKFNNLDNVRLIVVDGIKLPFNDLDFDLCVSFTVLQDIPKALWKKFTTECLRVARETWITLLKRNKILNDVIENISIPPDRILEEDSDFILIYSRSLKDIQPFPEEKCL